MIIDYQHHINDGLACDVLDAETGKPINISVFYADDEAGVIRYFRRDEDGRIINIGNQIAWAEERRKIRIVPKPVPAR